MTCTGSLYAETVFTLKEAVIAALISTCLLFACTAFLSHLQANAAAERAIEKVRKAAVEELRLIRYNQIIPNCSPVNSADRDMCMALAHARAIDMAHRDWLAIQARIEPR